MSPAPEYVEHSEGVRIGRELLDATRPYASEIKGKSRWYVVSTFALTLAVLAGAGVAQLVAQFRRRVRGFTFILILAIRNSA